MIQKYNIPIITEGGVPNANNLSDEMTTITTLATKVTRSNVGQLSYTSTTSGITYNTASYPSVPNIYNKGETGLYNLLIRELDEYILQAKDLNSYGTGTIPTTGWSTINGKYKYSINITIPNVTSDNIVNMTIDKDSVDVALRANMCPTNESFTGGITVYSMFIPKSAINFTYTVLK